jgi:hypothetical protein
MTALTPEDVMRLNLLYDLLDAGYTALRESSRIQRMSVIRGCLPATLIADMNLMALSKSITQTWTEIQGILTPKVEVGPEPPPAGDPPPKETVQ